MTQIFPVETIAAFFPPRSKVGGIQFYPVTFYHVAMMAALDIDINAPITDNSKIITAAWILSYERIKPDLIEPKTADSEMSNFFSIASLLDMDELRGVINGLIASAFNTYIPSNGAQTENIRRVGNGWILELAEAISAEHGRPFFEVAQMPICTAFALAACARIRNGGENGGPSYWERMEIEDIKKAISGKVEEMKEGSSNE